MALDPSTLLQEAVRAVPAVKYALGVAGLLAVLGIAKAFGLDTVVTFTLTPTGTGTHLRMEQSGFGPNDNAAFYGARAGWTQFLKALEETLKQMD